MAASALERGALLQANNTKHMITVLQAVDNALAIAWQRLRTGEQVAARAEALGILRSIEATLRGIIRLLEGPSV
jgi:hypothetical protein